MEEEKYKADLIAGFGSFSFLPMLFMISKNNVNPKLLLFSDHIECRVGFSTRTIKYHEIKKIGVFLLGKGTNNLVIYKSFRTYSFNFRNRTQLFEFLKHFENKGCVLTNRAKKALSNTT